jgi:hypothetical protein
VADQGDPGGRHRDGGRAAGRDRLLVGDSAMLKSGLVLTLRVVMQSLCWFENSCWIVYVLPTVPVNVPCWPLQMSPISPWFGSYQVSGGPITVARPTSASVTASIRSCDDTDWVFWNVVPPPGRPGVGKWIGRWSEVLRWRAMSYINAWI